MSFSLFAMDTSFYHSTGSYEFDTRCEILRDIGYDGTYLTLWNQPAWDDVPRLATVKEKFGLEVAGVFVALDLAQGEMQERIRQIHRLLGTVEGCSNIELCLRSKGDEWTTSDESKDDFVISILHPMLEIASQRGISISLYPHVDCWLERTTDVARLCRKIDQPNLRAVFCGYHWFATDGSDPFARLTEISPWLRSVNLCGIRNDPSLPRPIVETLDQGHLDNFQILGALHRIGYSGQIGIQGFSVGGDVYTKLKRTHDTFRDMVRRLQANPHWANLRPPAPVLL